MVSPPRPRPRSPRSRPPLRAAIRKGSWSSTISHSNRHRRAPSGSSVPPPPAFRQWCQHHCSGTQRGLTVLRNCCYGRGSSAKGAPHGIAGPDTTRGTPAALLDRSRPAPHHLVDRRSRGTRRRDSRADRRPRRSSRTRATAFLDSRAKGSGRREPQGLSARLQLGHSEPWGWSTTIRRRERSGSWAGSTGS